MVLIETGLKLDFKDVLIRPKRSFLSSRCEVSLIRNIKMKNSGKQWSGVPIIAANMDTIGTFEMAKALASRRIMTAIHKHYSVQEWINFAKENIDCIPFVAVSSGIGSADKEKLGNIMKAVDGLGVICIDVANGYSEAFVHFIRDTRDKYPHTTIIAGNVVTQEMTEELILSGADIVKVGIGPGSVCTTRKQTGVGYPQLSAVIECAEAAHGLGGHIISDGGCTCPGDIVKAFGGGADFVMLGGMLAGHDECGGAVVTELKDGVEGGDAKRSRVFYGMSSAVAMVKYTGQVADYRSSEGKAVRVECRGPVGVTVNDILGGIRSACTYIGASEIRELPKRTTFIRVSMQVNESFGKA